MSRAAGLALWLGLLLAAGAVLLSVERLPEASAEDAPASPREPASDAPRLVERRPVGPPVLPSPAPAPEVASRWVEVNNLAVQALADGELERAVELLESCHAAEPERPDYRNNLSEALVRLALRRDREEGARAEARPLLERAAELDPEREELAELLERWRLEAEVEQGFTSDESGLFVLSYDGARDDILHGYQDVIDLLEGAYGELWELFQADPVRAGRPRVQVLLYRQEGFHALTGLGHWAGGVFDGKVRVPVHDLAGERARLERVLRHELVHWFVLEVGGEGVPGWLNEGLAQWLEGDRAAAVARARERLAAGEPYPLADLHGSLASWEEREAITRAYAQSLALTDHVARHHGSAVLFDMVRGCAAERAPGATFEEATGVGLDVVLEDLRRELTAEHPHPTVR